MLRQELVQLRTAIDKYYSIKGSYPATLSELVGASLIPAIPVDPITKRNDTWIIDVEQSESMPNSKAIPGIYDVHM